MKDKQILESAIVDFFNNPDTKLDADGWIVLSTLGDYLKSREIFIKEFGYVKLQNLINDFQPKLACKLNDKNLPCIKLLNSDITLDKTREISELLENIDKNPYDVKNYLDLAKIYRSKNCFEDSLTYFKKIIELKPNDPRTCYAFTSCADIYKKQYKFFEAINYYNQAIKLKNDDLYANQNILKLINDLAKKSFENLSEDINCSITYINNAIKFFDKNQDLYAIRAKLREINGEVELAISDYNKAIELNPMNSYFYTNKAILCKKTGNINEAIDCYKNAINVVGENSSVAASLFIKLGHLYHNNNCFISFEEAEKCYKKSIEINNINQNNLENVSAYTSLGNLYKILGKFTEALEFYQKGVLLNTEENNHFHKTGIYVEIGKTYHLLGKFDFALENYNIALKLKGENNFFNVGAYMEMGKAYTEIGKFKEALDCYNKILELNKLNPLKSLPSYNSPVYKRIGDIYQSKGDFSQAIDYYNKAIKVKGENDSEDITGVYVQLGRLYRDIRDFEKALEYYEKAIEINPIKNVRLIPLYNNLGNLYRSWNKYDMTKALDCYNKSIELSEQAGSSFKAAPAYVNRGNYFRELGKIKEAEENFNTAISLNPESIYAGVYGSRGLLFLEQGKFEDAEKDFNTAISLNQNSFGAYLNRAELYCSQNKFDKAKEDFKMALEKSFNIEEKRFVCFSIVNRLIKDRNFDRAKEFLQEAYPEIRDLKYPIPTQDSFDSQYKRQLMEYIEIARNLELQIKEKEKAYIIAHEKEKEMLSFFTHTMRNVLSSAPESLRQAIRLLGSEDYEKNKIHYEAINEITALFSTLSLVDCLVDTFKQSIYDPEKFKLNWEEDNIGEATPQWFIAAALRQSLNRIIFISNTRNLIKLLQGDVNLIKPTRKSFIEQVLPLDIDQQGVESFYQWLNTIPAIDISIEENTVQFGVNQIKFSLFFSITSELIFNALKYWSGTGQIQIRWFTEQDYYLFTVKNACKKNASSNLAGTHQGLAFIKRLMELLDDKTIKTHSPAQFKCYPEDHTFTAELKLHKTLLENYS